MDGSYKNLYFSLMVNRRARARTIASALVPAYFLYGEALQPPEERLIHIETVAARSRLHDWTIRPHRHRDLHQVIIIERGSVYAHIDGRAAHLSSPAAVILPPGTVHSFEFRPETAGLVVSFAAALVDELRAANPSLQSLLQRAACVKFDPGALRSTDLPSLGRMLLLEFGRSAVGRRLALSGLLGAMLANLQRLAPSAAPMSNPIKPRDGELVARFREQLERRFRKQAGLAEYAEHLQASEARLRRACRAVTGQPPKELIYLRMLVEAERMLRYTSMSVAQVAYYLGFEDPAYFSRFFTRRMGVPPRAFRRRDAWTTLEPDAQ